MVVTDARSRLGAVRLPALPEVLVKLLTLYRREDASIDEFTALIATDPVMAAKVMTVANSAAYRSGPDPDPVRDLPRSLNLLGTETVRTIVISQAIFQAMHGVPELRRVDLTPYWRHSLLTAALCRELARRIGVAQEDEAYLAGLLHDIGRLALVAAAPEFHAEGMSPDDDAARCAVERRWLKVDHAEAGAWLIGRWRLGRALADSARYHHEPLPRLIGTDPLIRIVALAHLIAQESPDGKRIAEAADICGLGMTQVTEATEQANAKLFQAAEHLGISLDDTGAPQRSSSAADQIEREVEPLLIAATLLPDGMVERSHAEQLQHIAGTARMVFQFDQVVPMLAGADRVLRWTGSSGEPQRAFGMREWQGFSLPIDSSPRIRDAIADRRPLSIDRARDVAGELAVSEDQLLRLLATDHVICLPLDLRHSDEVAETAMLVCAGNSALMADMLTRQALLGAFVSRAEASSRRVTRQRGKTEEQLDRRLLAQVEAGRDLAHEINNPLAIIQNYLEILNVKLGRSDALSIDEQQDLGGDIALLQHEVARVGRLVDTLAAHPQASSADPVDVDRLITETVRLFRSEAEAAGISISSHLQPARIEPAVERDALAQVLVNLLKNAVEALSAPQAADSVGPDGALIVVSNHGLVNRDGRLWLEIDVRDNGPGMPAEMLSQLFAGAPAEAARVDGSNASTESRMARGRGLTIVHRLVRAMGATIQCRSNLAGTSFNILLPCRQQFQPITEDGSNSR